MGLIRNIEAIARTMQEVAEIARRWDAADNNKAKAETPETETLVITEDTEVKPACGGYRRSKWRPSEDKILKNAVASGCSYEEIVEKLPGRTYDSIASRANLLRLKYTGSKNGVPWTPEEDEILKSSSRIGYTFEDIAKVLPGRTAFAVAGRFYTLGLNRFIK